MQERTKNVGDKGDRATGVGAKRRYAAPRLKIHGSVETVTQRGRGRGHDKPKHTKHPHQHP